MDGLYLRLLGLGRHDKQFCGRVDDIDFAYDSGRVRCHEKASKMIDNELVSA